MNEVLSYFLESVVSMGLFWLFYKWVIEKENMLNFGRFYLLSTSVFSLVFPLISIRLPASLFSVNQVTDEFIIYLNQVNVQGDHATQNGVIHSIPFILVGIYLTGVIILTGILVFKFVSLFRFIRNQTKERKGKYILLSGNNEPRSFSLFHYIFIGNLSELADHDRFRILEHEKVHADQKHSYDLLYFEVLSVIFWFNPFVWLYKSLVVDVHEYLADKAVIRQTGTEGYPDLLVRQAIGLQGLQPVSSFNNSTILKRINKMKTYSKKSNKLIVAIFLPVVMTVFFMISCSDNQMLNDNTSSDSGLSDSSLNADNLQADIDESVIPIDTVTQEVIAQVKVRPESENNIFELIVGARFDTVRNRVYDEVDVVPEFEGGYSKFFAFIGDNLKYPLKAKNEGIQGQVLVYFIVDNEGNLRNIKVIKGIDPECDREALRVLSLSPRWKPGIKDGQPVAVKMILPIFYRLDTKK